MIEPPEPLPIIALPAVILAVTARLARVPTLVIFGCELVYTVPAINALATCPVTLAPVRLVSCAPLAIIFVTDNVFEVLSNVKFALPANILLSLN